MQTIQELVKHLDEQVAAGNMTKDEAKLHTNQWLQENTHVTGSAVERRAIAALETGFNRYWEVIWDIGRAFAVYYDDLKLKDSYVHTDDRTRWVDHCTYGLVAKLEKILNFSSERYEEENKQKKEG